MNFTPAHKVLDDKLLDIISLPGKGRCFVTTRTIAKGDIVFNAEPFARVVDQESVAKGTVCSKCVKEPKEHDLPLNITCHAACSKFCSQKCLEESNSGMLEPECSFKIIETLSNYAKDYTSLLIRVLKRMKSEPEHAHISQINGMWFSLESQTIEQVAEYRIVMMELDRFCKERLDDFTHPALEAEYQIELDNRLGVETTERQAYLYSLISKEECNSFGLYTFSYKGYTEHRQGFGLALYPSAIYFNHSCDPNVGRVYTANGQMQFFAIKDILIGQEALITYIDLDGGLETRQKFLQEHFLFECGCTRCNSEKAGVLEYNGSLALCGSGGCRASLKPVDKTNWECIGCFRLINA